MHGINEVEREPVQFEMKAACLIAPTCAITAQGEDNSTFRPPDFGPLIRVARLTTPAAHVQ
jgi:hypothetical protein